MRLLFVSSHYPPNFVSGGTLVPQRLARGLAARGHHVAVFAGHLGDDPGGALREWDDRDGPIGVHWIDVTPFTSWEDPRNVDNPGVTEAFRRFLRAEGPDVVHLHSLQTFGAPLVTAAAEAGAATVVTMHDFWWFCARQFLVDRDLVPCCPVIEAGVCACQQGRDALRARTAVVAPHLARADRVVVPSEPMARIIAANGIANERIVVEENGVPDRLAASPPAERTEVVVRCLGGADAMKGGPVLTEAIRRLGSRPDVRFVVHGDAEKWDDWLEPGDPVDVVPAFPPDELGAVLAATDVLVVPSLARESFSLAIREAMAAGVAVVSSDSPGASAAIEHGRNGLLVPTGDSVGLAGAIAELLDDPSLRDRLARTATGVRIRTVEDHVDAVERLSREVIERRTASAARTTIGSVAYVVGIDGAPLRYRAQLPAEALATVGVETSVHHYQDPATRAAVHAADVVVLYRVPATANVLALVEELRARSVPVVFDVDDLIFDPEAVADLPGLAALGPAERVLYHQGVRRYRTTLEAADFFTASTPVLVEAARRCAGVPGAVVPNGVGLALARRSDEALRRPRAGGPLRVGYFSGTTTHDADWAAVAEGVVEAVAAHPDAVLVLGGHLEPGPTVDRLGERVERVPFQPWDRLPGVLRDLDVNLAPLETGLVFNEAKSAIKWLEAALVATPTVASPTGPFREAVEDGRTGLLATSPDEWHEAVAALLADDGLRSTMGGRARNEALLRWAPAVQAARILDALGQARSAPRSSSWEPEAPDEPWATGPVALTPYPPAAEPPEATPAAEPVPEVEPENAPATLLARAWWSLRHDGVGPSARRIARRVTGRR